MWRHIDAEITPLERLLLELESQAVDDTQVYCHLLERRAECPSLLERLQCLNYSAHSTRKHAKADISGFLLAWLVLQEQPGALIAVLLTSSRITVHTHHVSYMKGPHSTMKSIIRNPERIR